MATAVVGVFSEIAVPSFSSKPMPIPLAELGAIGVIARRSLILAFSVPLKSYGNGIKHISTAILKLNHKKL